MFSGCATQKKKGDVSKLGKFYHNTTSKYNGYFNANVLYEESLVKLNASRSDNFTQILPLYTERAVPDPRIVASDLDQAVEKLSVVISLHRVADWTDDSYLLMGKSQYLKQDFEAAEETFEFFESEFDPVSLKKKNAKISAKKTNKQKKKERKEKIKTKEQERKERMKEREKRIKARKRGKTIPEKPKEEEKKEEVEVQATPVSQPEPLPEAKSGMFVHENVYAEGLLWLARTYIERDKFSLAHSTMSKLATMPVTKELRREIPVVEAYYFLEQGQTGSAIPKLHKSIELADDRKLKGRYAFILAQIYERNGVFPDAIKYYDIAIQNRVNYEMTFHSKLNKTVLEYTTGKISASELDKQLERMLKDEKNLEYEGYIHLSLASAANKRGDNPALIAHLKDALAAKQIDAVQRTEAYYQLSELYFQSNRYADAKDYYDSTGMFMAQSDMRKDYVTSQADLLKDIARNIRVIELQDSLIRVSRMSQDEKNILAAKIIEKQRANEGNTAGGNNTASNAPGIPGNKRFPEGAATAVLGGGAGNLSSNFFAYDPRNLRKAKRDFENKWGDRNLEDDWRRSNKRRTSFFEEDAPVEESLKNLDVTQADLNGVLAGVPSNPKEIAEANNKLMEALFELGSLYRDQLLDNERAIASLEELLERFPDTKHKFDAWFLLYLANSDLGNTAEAKKYGDLIIDANPDSKYAMVIKDPNYSAKVLSAEQKLIQYYDDTYEAFQSGDYQYAYERIENSSQVLDKDHELVPRFALLKAMCTGHLDSRDAYITELKEVIAKYPGTPEAVRSKEIMRFLQGDREAFEEVSAEALLNTSFTLEDNSLHYVIAVIFELGTNSLDDAKISAANYNRDYYRNEKFRVAHNNLSIEPKVPIILIRKFDSKTDALKYTERIDNNREQFLPKGVNYDVFAITQQNYREVMKQRSVNEYRLFYQEYYKNK
jgi:tetratricopeptide (TPR) repeat protein